jgi:hypothetical protein
VGVGLETRIDVREATADPGVEQLRIDRPADVNQFSLLRVDAEDPKLAPRVFNTESRSRSNPRFNRSATALRSRSHTS